MQETSHEYIFPFNTCEKPQEDSMVKQPYSVLVNGVNCAIILFFLVQTKHIYTFLLLFSFLAFEAFHMYSHIVHIPGTIQVNIAHTLSYIINGCFLYFFYTYTKTLPSILFGIYLTGIIILDIFFFTYYDIVYYLITQSLFLISLFFYYSIFLPKQFQESIYLIIGIVLIILFLVLNEKYNCKKMLAWNPDFPYHIFIETVGIFLFYIISSRFYRL